MHAFTKCLIAGALASAPAIVASSSAHAQAGYTLTFLDDGGNPNVIPTGINDDGEMVGRVSSVPFVGSGPFWASAVATPAAISQPAGSTWWYASKINANGDMVGRADLAGRSGMALWDNGVPSFLNFGGADTCGAFELNDNPTLVGSCRTGGVGNAVMWNSNVPTNLPNPTGGDECYASGVNNSDVVVGTCSFTIHDYKRPVIWNNGAASALPMPNKVTSAYALAINDAGVAVGEVRTPSSNGWIIEAGIWANRATKLKSPAGASSTTAIAISNGGDVLGRVFGQDGKLSAVVWLGGASNGLVVLPKGGFEHCEGFDINTDGTVVGFCYDMADPTDYPVIWTV